jgi:outer membrane protein OmpA-like peptidoglycan-associated protein
MRLRSTQAVGIALLIAQGCSSGYQRAYDRETQKLQAQAQAEDTKDKAEYAKASRYAAVVYFDTGSAVVGKDGERELQWFVDQMQPYPKANILVQGFADTTGSEDKNRTLSEDRAKAVAAVLASKGIAASRIQATGYGTDSPAAANTTPKGRNRNRRVEVTVR